MRIPMPHAWQRKAISPIIATVLIIAVTLIAAVAIGGYVFGVFGSSAASAQISVTSAALAGASFTFANGGTTVTCATAPGGTGLTMALTNTGTAAGTVTGVTITWAGATNAFTISGACSVGAAGSATATTYVIFAAPHVTINAASGQTFSGTVTLSNGAQLLFTGTWQ